jgi:hypothetical protein
MRLSPFLHVRKCATRQAAPEHSTVSDAHSRRRSRGNEADCDR